MDDPRSNEDVSTPEHMTAPPNTGFEQAYSTQSAPAAPVSDEDDPGFVLGYN